MKKPIHPNQIPLSFMFPESSWTVPSELPDLRGRGRIAIDLETKDDGLNSGRGPGWAYRAGYICGVSMAAGDRSVYAPVAHPETSNFDADAVQRWLRDHLLSQDRKVFQNAPYDLGWMWCEWDLPPPDLLDDTMAMAYILDEMLPSRSLEALCKWQGIPGKDETMLRQAAEAIGGDPKKDLWRLPAKYVGPYAEQDAVSTLQLAERMWPQIEAQGLADAYQLEADLIPMVLEMRKRGIRIDVSRAAQVREELLRDRDEALGELSRQCAIGRPLEIGDLSSPRIMKSLFEQQGVPFPETEKGNPSFSTDWMEKRDHWLPNLATVALKMHDAGEKFIGSYIQDFTHHGRIHAEIHQYKDDRGGTRTSRFAYSNPPLQQMPSRNPRIAKAIRSLFLPEPGEVWGALDYSQQEFRLMVHFASVCRMAGVAEAVRMYREDPDTDFHNLAAQLTRLPRRKAKDVNFAKAFGAGKKKFADMTGMSLDEAVAAMQQYDQELPFISRLSEFCQARAQERGFIRLIDGARSRFERWEPRWVDWNKMRAHMEEVGWPDMPTNACSREEATERTRNPRHYWYQERLQRAQTHKAMNSLIQGSAARQTKMAMRQCWREGIVPLLQMHDELSSSFSDEGPARRMQEIMIEVVQLEVPVKVDAEFGVNWGTAKEDKDTGYRATFAEAWARRAV